MSRSFVPSRSWGGTYASRSYSVPSPPPQYRPAIPQAHTLATSSASLEVQVPQDARVYVDGDDMQDSGALRRYVWRRLAPGRSFDVEVRVELTRAGKQIEQTKTARIRADGSASLSFGMENPVTQLTLNVPQDAVVYLFGHEKPGKGTVRKFRTRKLAEGEAWSEYAVRVSLRRDGRLLSKEQTIALQGGDSKTLTFAFDTASVAAAE